MLSRFIRSSSTYAHRICEMGKTLLANPRYISSSRTLYDDDWMGMVDDEEIEMLSTNFQSPFATPKPAEAAKKMADNLKEGKISAINDLEAKIALQAIAEKYKKYNFAFAVISAGCDADPQIRSLIEATKSSSKPTIALILLHNVLYQSSSIGHYFAAFIKPDEIFLIDNNGREKYRRDLCEAPYPGPQEYNIEIGRASCRERVSSPV